MSRVLYVIACGAPPAREIARLINPAQDAGWNVCLLATPSGARFIDSAALELARVRRLIAERIPAVPRLRQRLVRAPFGCGGPIWVDDPGFDIHRHVRTVACPEPADERALLDTALAVIMSPLPRAALWPMPCAPNST